MGEVEHSGGRGDSGRKEREERRSRGGNRRGEMEWGETNITHIVEYVVC